MEKHWLALLLGGVCLFWLISLLGVRYWTRRCLLKTLLEQELPEEANYAPLESRPEDQAARNIIRAYRRRYLLKIWPDTEFSFKAINEMSLEVVQEIARVYYPDEERPELKASLADLVALYNRVGERLASWLETFPIRAVKDVEIQSVLRYHELYQNLRNHPTYRFIKRHHLDKVVRWGWTAYNYANPWYWGRKAAYEGGKEMVSRLVLAQVADFVGEEAMRLYGRRQF